MGGEKQKGLNGLCELILGESRAAQEEENHLLAAAVRVLQSHRCILRPRHLSPKTSGAEAASCSWTWEGGFKKFGMFIVNLVSAVTNNRCPVYTNTIILQHARMLTRISRGFPIKPRKHK